MLEILEQHKIDERLDVCNKCPHVKEFSVIYQEELLFRHKCGMCGCTCENKAKYAIWKCPDNKF
jgi:MinD superfamily P-loop ATPase